jgi:hypothetical protein
MRTNITHTFILAVTDDFKHYLSSIPKVETSEQVMTRIRTLYTKLQSRTEEEDRKEGRTTRYTIVLDNESRGELNLSYTYIEDYGNLFAKNILMKQKSRMLTDKPRDENEDVILA